MDHVVDLGGQSLTLHDLRHLSYLQKIHEQIHSSSRIVNFDTRFRRDS